MKKEVVVLHTYNPIAKETARGRFLWFGGPSIPLGANERHCLKQNKAKQNMVDGVPVRVSIAVKGHHDHSNSYKGKPLIF